MQAIILHQTNATTLESTLDYTRPKGTASAHYIIDTDGQIYGTLDPDTQIARHNGANEYCVNTLREYVYN
ncbi:MAG: N-acetylmuramoyl-L-alanine amidase [Candidatus Peribacteria bacterium]|nr:MAG: N-acetylmuramoyl-L-alanine amidase [Candidatus Peribacteria bacterium]